MWLFAPLSLPHGVTLLASFRSSVFVADELDFALRPVLEAVWDQDPESYPFRQPVDPKSLGIPVRSLKAGY